MIWRALLYFLREATVGLARSWKVSLVAVLTIAVSLLVGGTVLMVGSNLAQAVADWQREARLIVYLHGTAGAGDLDTLRAALASSRVGPAGARGLPRGGRPALRAVPQTGGPSPRRGLPAPRPRSSSRWRRKAARRQGSRPGSPSCGPIRRSPWSMTTATGSLPPSACSEWCGLPDLALAVLLLGAAVFTIASVVRLISLLYRDEIAVLRLVGATEFFVRGPFYFEGMLQGLLGAVLALGTLGGAWLAAGGEIGRSASLALLFSGFLSWPACLLLLGLGPAAGLAGAVLSLQREEPGTVGRPSG